MDLSCPGGWLNCHPIGQFLTIGIQWDSAVAEKPKLRRWRKKKLAKKNYRFEVGGQRSRAAAEGLEGVWLGCLRPNSLSATN